MQETRHETPNGEITYTNLGVKAYFMRIRTFWVYMGEKNIETKSADRTDKFYILMIREFIR
jgi:hypothetical protein